MPASTTPMMLVQVYSETPTYGARMRPATSSSTRVQALLRNTTTYAVRRRPCASKGSHSAPRPAARVAARSDCALLRAGARPRILWARARDAPTSACKMGVRADGEPATDGVGHHLELEWCAAPPLLSRVPPAPDVSAPGDHRRRRRLPRR